MADEYQGYLSIAVEAAKTAGKFLQDVSKSNIQIVEDLTRDIKLKADMESETLILNILKQNSHFPILTEERGLVTTSNSPMEKEYQWIVDPLDGSMNFSRGVDVCCVSIALWQDSNPVLGVVYDFNRNEIFTGFVNGGAWLNGNPISTGKVREKSKSVLATGFPVSMNFSQKSLSTFTQNFSKYKKIRMIGSAALSLAYVASGRFDIYQEKNIKIWDVAAGLALVKAAGGAIQCIGFPESDIVYASGRG